MLNENTQSQWEQRRAAARLRNAGRLSKVRSLRATKPIRKLAYVLARRAFSDPTVFGLEFNFRKKRAEAKQLNHQFYFTGSACRRGHYAPRHTVSRLCAVCTGDKRFPVILKH
jgi:hypothetical protein